jgi:serine/threonine protein kinase
MPLTSGTRLGQYEIRSPVGEGGMGEVYLALDTKLDRTVALKVLTPEVARDNRRMGRFVLEAKAASALSHPNVAHIYEIDEADGTSFIAMEYVEGRPLDHVIAGQPLPTAEVLDIAAQIADALDEAHSKRIVHRDIKPSNVIITPRSAS